MPSWRPTSGRCSVSRRRQRQQGVQQQRGRVQGERALPLQPLDSHLTPGLSRCEPRSLVPSVCVFECVIVTQSGVPNILLTAGWLCQHSLRHRCLPEARRWGPDGAIGSEVRSRSMCSGFGSRSRSETLSRRPLHSSTSLPCEPIAPSSSTRGVSRPTQDGN